MGVYKGMLSIIAYGITAWIAESLVWRWDVAVFLLIAEILIRLSNVGKTVVVDRGEWYK